MKMKKIVASFSLLIGFALTALSADEIDKGLEAYKNNDFKSASTLYKKACDGGNVQGCGNLAFLYQTGQGVKQDYFKASTLYKKACDGSIYVGCLNLGILYAMGKGVGQSSSKAKALFKKACDGGEALGCENYAILNKKGH